jgi:hypothetical protein
VDSADQVRGAEPVKTTQDLLNELANESDEIAGQVEFWPVSTDAGNVRNNSPALIEARSF